MNTQPFFLGPESPALQGEIYVEICKYFIGQGIIFSFQHLEKTVYLFISRTEQNSSHLKPLLHSIVRAHTIWLQRKIG